MRVTAMFLLFLAGDALAAGDGASTGRLDFANTPAFHSVFDNRVPWAGTAAQSASGISAKMRIAMWTTSSELPSRTEILVALPPSALPRVQALKEIVPESAPRERITAKMVRSAHLEENPPTRDQLTKRKRFKRRVLSSALDIDDDGPSSFLQYQRRALSNGSDVDDDAQPSFLGQRVHSEPPDVDANAQPSFLGRILGALFPSD